MCRTTQEGCVLCYVSWQTDSLSWLRIHGNPLHRADAVDNGMERNMEEAQRITKHKKEGTFSFISLLDGSFSFILKGTLFINAIFQS
jgi:hypothetical protein